MALTVDEYIESLYPKLALSPEVDIYKEMASYQTSADYYGSAYNLALALRACHYFTVDERAEISKNSGGAVTGLTEGRVSMTFWNSTPDGDHSTLNSTNFGQRLKSLMKSIGPSVSSNGLS